MGVDNARWIGDVAAGIGMYIGMLGARPNGIYEWIA
jgi:hypothetical protein